MTNITNLIEDQVEDDEDDYLLDDDFWEDADFPQRIKDQFPNYQLLKITNFNGATLSEIKAWCVSNITRGHWETVGWNSGCAYSVGVVIESARDAMLFKLRWS